MLVDPFLGMFQCYFVRFLLLIFPVRDGKTCFSIKKMILTNKLCVEHPFTGQNTQHMKDLGLIPTQTWMHISSISFSFYMHNFINSWEQRGSAAEGCFFSSPSYHNWLVVRQLQIRPKITKSTIKLLQVNIEKPKNNLIQSNVKLKYIKDTKRNKRLSKKEKRKKDSVKKKKIECYQDKLLSKENVIDRILMTIVQRKVILLTRPKFTEFFLL